MRRDDCQMTPELKRTLLAMIGGAPPPESLIQVNGRGFVAFDRLRIQSEKPWGKPREFRVAFEYQGKVQMTLTLEADLNLSDVVHLNAIMGLAAIVPGAE
jgi:hypothetical protein